MFDERTNGRTRGTPYFDYTSDIKSASRNNLNLYFHEIQRQCNDLSDSNSHMKTLKPPTHLHVETSKVDSS